VVAGLDGGHRTPDRLNDTGRFVPENSGDACRNSPMQRVQITVTNTARRGLDQYFVWGGSIDFDGLNR